MATTTSPIYKLVLHPVQADYGPSSWLSLKHALQDQGFIGEQYDKKKEMKFLVGDKFLQLITFMGCSPYIQLEPPDTDSNDFCHIEFSEIYPDVQFRYSDKNLVARCSQCRQRIDWHTSTKSRITISGSEDFSCSHCGATINPCQLDWRHTAGFARLFIDIFNIYPHEGIPNDSLFAGLEKSSGHKWTYFYTE